MNLKRFDIYCFCISFSFSSSYHTFKYDALQQEARLLNTMHAISSVSSVVRFGGGGAKYEKKKKFFVYLFRSQFDRIIIQKDDSSHQQFNQRKRNINTTIKAKDEGFEVPDFVKDLMKPPDSSIAAPGWLAPLLGLAKESGESAVGIGYALMIVTSVFFSLVFAVIGLPGFLCALIFVGASGYTCWQATPYLNEIVKEVESGFTDDD